MKCGRAGQSRYCLDIVGKLRNPIQVSLNYTKVRSDIIDIREKGDNMMFAQNTKHHFLNISLVFTQGCISVFCLTFRHICQWAKSPKKQSVGVHFGQYGTVF